jgi:hypothetical protein
MAVAASFLLRLLQLEVAGKREKDVKLLAVSAAANERMAMEGYKNLFECKR